MLPVRFTNPRRVMMTWDPFRSFDRLGRLFDQANDKGGESACSCFPVDVHETDKQYVVEANLPGFGKDDVELTFQDGVLTIEAQTKRDEERKEGRFHVRERYVGKVARSFKLPVDVDAEMVTASMKDGVLTVTLDKSDSVLPRKIAVKSD